MENTSNTSSIFEMKFDERVSTALRGTAMWAGVAAITSLIGSIVSLVSYFVEQNKLNQMRDYYGGYSRSSTADGGGLISAIISFAIGVLLFVFLNKFSSETKKGVDANSQGLINTGLSNLSSYFKTVGILLIIVIVIALLAILAGIGGGFK